MGIPNFNFNSSLVKYVLPTSFKDTVGLLLAGVSVGGDGLICAEDDKVAAAEEAEEGVDCN